LILQNNSYYMSYKDKILAFAIVTTDYTDWEYSLLLL